MALTDYRDARESVDERGDVSVDAVGQDALAEASGQTAYPPTVVRLLRTIHGTVGSCGTLAS